MGITPIIAKGCFNELNNMLVMKKIMATTTNNNKNCLIELLSPQEYIFRCISAV